MGHLTEYFSSHCPVVYPIKLFRIVHPGVFVAVIVPIRFCFLLAFFSHGSLERININAFHFLPHVSIIFSELFLVFPSLCSRIHYIYIIIYQLSFNEISTCFSFVLLMISFAKFILPIRRDLK